MRVAYTKTIFCLGAGITDVLKEAQEHFTDKKTVVNVWPNVSNETKAWFRGLVRHPARKHIGPILYGRATHPVQGNP